MAYYIFTDATTDLNVDYVKAQNFEIIPMSYSFGEEAFMHSPYNKMQAKEFYEKVNAGNLPNTAALSPFITAEAWKPALEKGMDIFHISFSSALSATYSNALLAQKEIKEQYPDRKIIVVDSKSASGGQALLVYYAILARDAGMSIEELNAYVEELIPNVAHLFTVDSLNHLHRTGRVSKTAAVIGSALQLKPCLHTDCEGKLVPLSKEIGRKTSLNWLVKKCETMIDLDKTKVFFLNDADCKEDADVVEHKLKEKFPNIPVVRTDIGPIIGSHSGKGTVALFFISKTGRK